MFPAFPAPHDIGQLVLEKVENEIRLHPIPSFELPQISGDMTFDFGRVRVHYHIDTRTAHAEITGIAVP